MKLIIIAAVNKQHVIGRGGTIPWHISDDLKRFKRLTTGHTVLMGRKTYESLGRQLPNRRNVVLTTRTIPGVETYASLDAALQALAGEEKVFIIGGGTLYAQTLAMADELCLTLVENEAAGDVFFPAYEELVRECFTLTAEERHEGFTFRDYQKRPPSDRRA
jgi:dihydrofolate reductase